MARPHYLANFNALIGPEHGYRVLVDSSLDWGQDLDELGRYLKDYPNKAELPIYLSYFGTADPTFHDLEVRLLPSFFDWPAILGKEATAPLDWTLEPGLYAISATMLQQTWSTVPREWGPGEPRDYARLTAHFAPLEQAVDPAAALREALLDTPTRKRWLRYRQLRLTRLCQILREREPDSAVGHSILLYRVTAEDLARTQTPPTLPAPRSG